MITRFCVAHSRANLFDDTRPFMPEDDGFRIGAVAFDVV
jgi:hypothetical protein